MRERTTWNKDQIKSAAMQRQADPYAMNQDHLSQQPAADKYVTGDPSTFAEDVTEPNTWEKEYAGGTTKRNEIGQPEYRSETFNHAEKTAALDDATLYKKAELCSSVAKLMLRGRKFASETAFEAAIEDQSVALMHMPNADLVATASRLAGEEEQQQQQMQQAGEQDQQQQAAQQEQAPAQGQEQQASAFQGGMSQQAIQQMVQKAVQECMAQQGQGQAGPGGQQAANYDSHKGPAVTPPGYGAYNGPQAPKLAKAKKADEQGQQQTQQAQVQQQDQGQAQQQAGQQDQGQQMQQQAHQQGQQDQGQMQAQEQGQQMQQQADDALLDEMLMGPDGGAPSEMDIEMETPSMDVGEVVLAHEDEVLKSLFATDESEQAQEAQAQGQQKQAGMSRTASTRTVGTRPTGGVSRVGGAPQGRTAGGDVDKLASLWPSAPDVRDAFNMR